MPKVINDTKYTELKEQLNQLLSHYGPEKKCGKLWKHCLSRHSHHRISPQ